MKVILHRGENAKTRCADVGALTFLLATQLVLIYQMMWKSLPSSSGWYMAWNDASATRVPYRDFFVPFPPGALFFEGTLPGMFSREFVAQDLIHAAFWLATSAALYLLMRFFVKPSLALLTTVVPLTAYFVQPGNIVSGYYETMYCFLILGLAMSLHGTRSKSLYLLLTGGLVLSLSTTVKQTSWLPALVVLLSIICRLGPFSALTSRCRLSFIFGAAIPWMGISTWNLAVGNFTEMWSALLTGGSKGTNQLTFIPLFLQSVVQFRELWVVIVIIGSVVILGTRNDSRVLFGFVSIVTTIWVGADVLLPSSSPNIGQALFLVYSGLALMLGHSRSMAARNDSMSRKVAIIFGTSLLVLMNLLPLSTNSGSGPLRIDVPLWFLQIGQRLTYSFYAIALCGLCICLIGVSRLSVAIGAQESAARVVAWIAISLQLMNSFAGTPTLETWLIVMPFGFLIIFELLSRWLEGVANATVSALVIAWLPSLVAVQTTTPYDWLGMRSPQLSALVQAPDVPSLSQFRLSPVRATFLTQLETVVEPLSRAKTEVLLGVRNAGFAALYDLQLYPTQCVVLWWDVCPESLAQQDLQTIKSSPPEAVLWTFEDESVIKGNEEAWRDGEVSAIRRMQEYLVKAIREKTFRVAFELPENDDGTGPVTKVLLRTLTVQA